MGDNFSANLDNDIRALESFRSQVASGVDFQTAWNRTMFGASQQAKDFAQNTDTATMQISKFKQQQRMAIVAQNAQNKSFGNARSIIKEYNSGCRNAGISQASFATAVGSSNKVMGNYLSGLNGANATIGGYVKSLVGAKTATLGLKAASIALNMVFTSLVAWGVGQAISSISSLINKQKEARNSAMQLANSSLDEVKNINKLYQEYNDVNNAYKANAATKEELESKTNELREALGLEATDIDTLIDKYGNLDKAINQATIDALRSKLKDIQNGYIAAESGIKTSINDNNLVHFGRTVFDLLGLNDLKYLFLPDDGYINFPVKIEGFTDNKTDKILQKFKEAGFNAEKRGNRIGLFYDDGEGLKMYEDLVRIKEIIEKEVGSGKIWESLEEVSKSFPLYEEVNAKIANIKDEYSEYFTMLDDANKVAAEINYYDFINSNGIPGTVEQYEQLRKSIIDAGKANGDFLGNQNDIDQAVDNFLETVPELSDVISDWRKKYKFDLKEEMDKALEKLVPDSDKLTAGVSSSITGALDQVDKNIVTDWVKSLEAEDLQLVNTDTFTKEIEKQKNLLDGAALTAENYNNALLNTKYSLRTYDTTPINALTESAATATTSVSKLNEVLNAQGTGHTISIDDFNSEELADYQSALEYVNGTMQLNAEKAREIAKAKTEEQIATNKANKEARQAQYMKNIAEIERLNIKLKDKNNLTKDEINSINQQIGILREQNSGYMAECSQIDILNSSLRESISIYNEWKNAQNAAESGDMFDDTISAIKEVNDVLNNTKSENYGRIGRNDYKASVKLLVPDTVDKDDEEAVNKYLKSVKELLTFDDDGNINGLNIEEFVDQALDKGLLVFDKSSNDYKIAGGKVMADFANGMNLSLPMIQAIFGELQEMGVEFDWGDELFTSFGDSIVATQQEITNLEDELTNLMNQKKAGIKIDSSQIDECKQKLKEAKKAKDDLIGKSVANIETHINLDNQVKDAEKDLTILKAKLKKATSQEEKIKITAEIDDAQNKIDSILQKKDELQQPTQVEIQVSLDEIDKQISNIDSQIESIQADITIEPEIKQDAIDTLNDQKKVLEEQKTTIEIYADANQAKTEVQEVQDAKVDDKKFDINVVDKASETLQRIENFKLTPKVLEISVATVAGAAIEKAKNIANNIYNKFKSATSGANKVSGTAKVSGDWGNKNPGQTLVGELGREIVVDPHTGRWYTVGDNGAEFVNIPKNAIVFNNAQTEDLLSHGFVASRAVALVNGTVHNSGAAMVTGGSGLKAAINRASKKEGSNSYSSNKSSSSKFSSSTSNTKKNTKAVNDNTKAYKNNTAAKKENSKATSTNDKTTIDWIERRIEVFTSKIDLLKAKLENVFTVKKKNTIIDKEIKNANKLLKTYTKADKKYSKLANKYAKKHKNVLTKSMISKIKNGTINVKDYSQETADIINQYKEWYDKAQEAKKSYQEAKTELRELKKEKYQNYVDRADKNSELYEARAESSTSAAKQNKYLKGELAQIKKSYDYQVKIALVDNDRVEAAKLRLEYERKVMEILKQQLSNIKDQADRKITVSEAKAKNVSNAERKRLLLDEAKTLESVAKDTAGKENDKSIQKEIKSSSVDETKADMQMNYGYSTKNYNALAKMMKSSGLKKSLIKKIKGYLSRGEKIPAKILKKVKKVKKAKKLYNKLLAYNKEYDSVYNSNYSENKKEWSEEVTIQAEEAAAEAREKRVEAAQIDVERTQQAIDALQAQYDNLSALKEKNQNLADQINKKNANYYAQEAVLKAQYTDANGKIIDQEEYQNKLLELEAKKKKELSESYLEMFRNILAEYDKLAEKSEHQLSLMESAIKRSQSQGLISYGKYYEKELAQYKSDLVDQEKELQDLKDFLTTNTAKLEANEYAEAEKQIWATQEAIEETKNSIIETSNALRELNWSNFELGQEYVSDIIDEAEFLIDIMSGEKLFEDNGKYTVFGNATGALLAQNYDVYMEMARSYKKEADSLWKDIQKDYEENGEYNTNLIKQYQQYIELQRESIKNSKSQKEAIKDLVSQGYDKLKDALSDIINKYLDILDEQKSLYDYQQSIREKMDELSSLRKQQTAMAGNETEENQADLQKITKQIKDAERDIAESEYDQYISDQRKMLDKFQDDFEEWINNRLDNIEGLLREMIDASNENVNKISQTIENFGSSVGYDVSQALSSIWDGRINPALTSFTNGVADMTNAVTTLNEAISQFVRDMANVKSEEVIEELAKDSSDTPSKLSSSLDRTFVSEQTYNPTTKTPTTTIKTETVSSPLKTPKQTAEDFIKAKAGKAKKKKKEYKAVNQKIYEMTGGKVLSDSNLKLLAKILGITYNNSSKKGNLYKKLHSLKVGSFSNGGRNIQDEFGLVDENGTNEFIRTADGAILTKVKGATIFDQPHTDMLYEMSDFAMKNSLKDSIGKLLVPSGDINTVNNTGDKIVTINLGGITMNGVNDVETLRDQVVSFIASDRTVQQTLATFTANGMRGKNSLAVRRYM